jgi:type IV pilus assembly protein PilW
MKGSSCSRQRGVTLIEVLVALTLGLFITAAVLSVFLSNRQAFRQTENLSRLQENARIAFEFLARDLREAGAVACGNNIPTANVIKDSSNTWWASWYDGVHGYDGTTDLPAQAFNGQGGNRVAGSDAVVIWSGTLGTPVTLVQHNPTDAKLQLSTDTHGLTAGDIAVVCDYQQAAVFQVSNATSNTVEHKAGNGVLPGNCRQDLGLSIAAPHDCSQAGSQYSFKAGGLVSRLEAYAWYLGHNGRGGTSLYRVNISSSPAGGAGGGTPTVMQTPEEMVEDVASLSIEYLITGGVSAPTAYVAASAVSDWTQVGAVRVTAQYVTPERVGTDANRIGRTFPLVVTIRNRMP